MNCYFADNHWNKKVTRQLQITQEGVTVTLQEVQSL